MRKPVGKIQNNKETKWELPAVVIIVRSIIGWKQAGLRMQALLRADAAFGRCADSNLPYRYWFVAMHLLTATKGSFPPPRYSDSWGTSVTSPYGKWSINCVTMGKRDDKYTLEGAIELDDAFFSTEISVEEKEKPLKRGRGSQKTKVW